MHQPLQMNRCSGEGESRRHLRFAYRAILLVIILSGMDNWDLGILGSYKVELHFNRTLGLSRILTTDYSGVGRVKAQWFHPLILLLVYFPSPWSLCHMFTISQRHVENRLHQ